MTRDELVGKIRGVLKEHGAWEGADGRACLVDDLADLLHVGPLQVAAMPRLDTDLPHWDELVKQNRPPTDRPPEVKFRDRWEASLVDRVNELGHLLGALAKKTDDALWNVRGTGQNLVGTVGPMMGQLQTVEEKVTQLEGQLGRLDGVDHRCDMLKQRMDTGDSRVARLFVQQGELARELGTRLAKLEEYVAGRCDFLSNKAAQLTTVVAAHTEQLDSLTDHVDSLDNVTEERRRQLLELVQASASANSPAMDEAVASARAAGQDVEAPTLADDVEALEDRVGDTERALEEVREQLKQVAAMTQHRTRPPMPPITTCARCAGELVDGNCPRCQKPGPMAPGTRGLRHG